MVPLIRRIIHFFIFSNLFIACCAVLMTWQTTTLLLNSDMSVLFSGFVFFATISSYSFHWLLTPDLENIDSDRLRWLSGHRPTHLILLIPSLGFSIFFGYHLLDHWPWLLLVAFVTFLYSAPKIPHPIFRALRKVAIGKTIFLAFVWMYVTTVLPLQISNESWNTRFTLFSISRFFLVYAICILFDYRDREYDRSIGIRSLITWLSEKGITWLFYGSLVIFATATILLANYDFKPGIILLLLIPGIILLFVYRYAITNFSDILYYFILDGLMALSSILTLLIYYTS